MYVVLGITYLWLYHHFIAVSRRHTCRRGDTDRRAYLLACINDGDELIIRYRRIFLIVSCRRRERIVMIDFTRVASSSAMTTCRRLVPSATQCAAIIVLFGDELLDASRHCRGMSCLLP